VGGLKEIRRRITSVSNTKQITRAMKLVSAAKLRRAQDAALNGRAYSDKLIAVVQNLLAELSEDFSHPLLEERKEVKRRLSVVISGERGLCGAYNTNVLKAIEKDVRAAKCETTFIVIGARTVSSAKRFGWDTLGAYEKLPENAAMWPIEEINQQMISGFLDEKYDEVNLFYTKFNSAISQVVTKETVLPLSRESLQTLAAAVEKDTSESKNAGMKVSPSAEQLIANLIPLVIAARLRQAGLESKASEHASRMTAMDSATKNADDLTAKLKLFYNRARQSAITTELIDIVGGAEAVK